ncbi:MAG: lipase, partial [Aeromicrobium sp.]|nr:lipase [Aeromicrobium sp.]
MRVVYDKAVVHETFSFRARVLQRAIRITFKPLLRYTPLTDRSLAAIRSF